MDILKPNVASLGYALFLAINAAGVWGGVFPFLPMDFQTHDIVLGFFLSQALVFSLSYFASAVGVYVLPGPTRAFLVKLASIPYFLGWCCLIAAMYLHELSLPFVISGGGLLGLGSAGFYMLWQRLFASQESDVGNRDLILGTAYAAVLYFALYLIPQAVTAFLIPLVFLPLFGLCIVLKSREINLEQPMFEDVPREHPHVYRQVMKDYWRSAFAVGALGFCTGIMRSLAIGEPHIGTLVNALSMGGALVAALAILALWQFKNLRLNVAGMYRFVFPFVITSFLLLPFAPVAYARWLAAILYAVYSVAIMLMMIQCAQASRDRGINPVFIYGFFGGIVYALHDVGFLGGTFAEHVTVIGISPLALAALVAVYLLGIMYFVGLGGFRHLLGRDKTADSIELVALKARGAGPHANEAAEISPGAAGAGSAEPCPTGAGAPAEANTPATAGKADGIAETAQAAKTSKDVDAAGIDATMDAMPLRPDENLGASKEGAAPPYRDRLSKQAQAVREHYRLSARETEVMELIARGNSVARIAEMLVVSENTVRTHAKRIYAKLDVHKRQELLDLVESFSPIPR